MADLFSNPHLAKGRERALTVYRSHRVRKTLLILAIVLVIFGLLGFLAAPSIIRSQIESRASVALQRPVTLGAVHLNPYTLRLQLDQLHIADRDGKSAFVDIDQAVIKASWSSLFRMAPVLNELALQHPRVRIVRTADQRFNFSDIIERFASKPTDPKTPPARFALSNISVHNGDIQFDDQLMKA
ncbi:MAG TPA: AsmA family protein, partial [Dyella sp.]